MIETPHEAAAEAHSSVEHVFGYLLNEIRAERVTLGLSSEFEFVALIHGHSASGEIATEIIKQFTEGRPIDSLKELLPDWGHKRPSAAKALALVQSKEPLFQIFLALYELGEHDTSYYDFHRTDATLLHIHNMHGRPA